MKTLSFAAALFLAGPASAFAHAQLQSASPPVGGTVSPPAELRLSFSEAVEPKFSGIAVSGPGGAVPLGKPKVAPGDGKALLVKIGRTLAPGAYTVKWHAVSVDTHRSQGDFDFTVK
jgi:methionine-rich copper-binding protein CopC